MQFNPIQVLMQEHEVISSAEGVVRSLEGTWQQDAGVYQSKVRTLLTFFKEYADGYHHHKEEEVLFPELKKCADFSLDEMVTEMEMHHQSFRDYAAEIENQLEKDNYPASYT